MRVVMLVPRRADGGRRDTVWAWVASRWAREHPDWSICEGHHDDGGPFNRSAAINQASTAAGDWDVAVIADSDTFVSSDQARRAVALAERTGQVTFGYDRFAYLGRRMSEAIMAGHQGDWWSGVEWTMTGTCSSMVTVTRALWDEVGGFDEGFTGWGGEDVGFSLACQAMGGGMQRVHGEAWHLHHPPAPHTADDVWPARMQRYAACDYDPARMRALLTELRQEVTA